MNIRGQLGRNKEFLLNATTGLLSGFLYLSYVLSFAFLVPVQHAFASRGRKSGFVAAAFAILVVTAGQAARMMELQALKPLVLLAAILPPLIMIVALGFVNLRIGALTNGHKILLASAVLSLAALPFVLRATSDKSFSSWLAEYVGAAMNSSGLGEGDMSYARAAVDGAIGVIRSAFSAFILWIVAGSWWLGSLFAARAQRREKKADESVFASLRIENLRVPSIALWPTLVSWALVFAILLTKKTGIAAVVVWNIALCCASLYAMQGIGILAHLAKKFNASLLLRIAAPLVVVAVALSSTAGTIMLIALPLLGITEVWLPYRNLKGALK